MIKVIASPNLSTTYDKRFVVIDSESGAVLDDAQGYGYKTPQKAHAAWAYKNRSRDKLKAQKEKERSIKAWMNDHKDFVKAMDVYSFEIIKGSWGPDEHFNAAFVSKMLKEYGYEIDFSAAELLRVWGKTK